MKKLISIITVIAILLTTLTLLVSCGGAPAAASVEATKYEGITWSYDSDTKTIKIVGDNQAPVEMKAFTKPSEQPWYSLRTTAVKIDVSGVKKISDYAFYGMYYVKELSFDSSLSEIGKCAFAFCTSLAELDLKANVTAIGESAFEGCAALKTVKLPASLESLGARAFAYNHLLTSVTIEKTFLANLSTESFNSAFEGIAMPTLTTFSANADGESTDAPSESEPSTDAPTETEPSTEAPAETAPTETEIEIAPVITVETDTAETETEPQAEEEQEAAITDGTDENTDTEEEESANAFPLYVDLPDTIDTKEQLRNAIIFILSTESVTSPTRLSAPLKRYFPDFKIKNYGHTKMKQLLEDLGLFVF